jgi:hypothetical protein
VYHDVPTGQRFCFSGPACCDDILQANLLHAEKSGGEAHWRLAAADAKRKTALKKDAGPAKKTPAPPVLDWVFIAGARRDPVAPPTAKIAAPRPNSLAEQSSGEWTYISQWPWRVPKGGAGAKQQPRAPPSPRPDEREPHRPRQVRGEIEAPWQPQFEAGAGWTTADRTLATLSRDAARGGPHVDESAAWRTRQRQEGGMQSVAEAEALLGQMGELRRY